MTQYKSNNIVYSCNYHVVWVTKYRRPVLNEAVELRLKEIIKNIALNIAVEILDLEIGDYNHVHLLLSVDPQFGIHKAVKRFKGATSRYLRQECPHLKSRLPTMKDKQLLRFYCRRCATRNDRRIY